MDKDEKKSRYDMTAREIAAVIKDETNLIARMATVSNLLHYAFDHYFWTGFYCVDAERPDQLVVGPYQGTMGCLRIDFGRGVCGAAAASGETQIVDDVHAFPGHIACDARSQSEIVVPVRDETGALIAVFDVDATEPAQFDQTDADALEAIIADSFGRPG